LSGESGVDRTLAAQTLLAAISGRGADAVGYAFRGPETALAVHKQRTGASELLEALSIPAPARQALIHVRDYTKGHPTIEANNHPVRHGDVVGVHNGIIVNDEEIFERHGFEREVPEMSVDTAAIFALADAFGSTGSILEELCGSLASAWVDGREPGIVNVARGAARPLWIGTAAEGIFFASTKHALEVFEHYMRMPLKKEELEEGTLLKIEEGHELARERFTPDRDFDERPLPAVRAPRERESCLRLLTALAALG
jgi:glucosamine 6-phosphate synthetase-like amidotransferase/phosphosugar isomerase protein